MVFQEKKVLFEWVKMGFESGDPTIKKEVQKIATNVMQSQHKAYKQVAVEKDDSDSDYLHNFIIMKY